MMIHCYALVYIPCILVFYFCSKGEPSDSGKYGIVVMRNFFVLSVCFSVTALAELKPMENMDEYVISNPRISVDHNEIPLTQTLPNENALEQQQIVQPTSGPIAPPSQTSNGSSTSFNLQPVRVQLDRI